MKLLPITGSRSGSRACAERNWSPNGLAQGSGVSRAMLSRLENAEVSPTTSMLAKFCSAYGIAMLRPMLMVEEDFPLWYGETPSSPTALRLAAATPPLRPRSA